MIGQQQASSTVGSRIPREDGILCGSYRWWGLKVLCNRRSQSSLSMPLGGAFHFRVLIDPSGPKNVGRVEVSSRPFLLHRLIRVVTGVAVAVGSIRESRWL